MLRSSVSRVALLAALCLSAPLVHAHADVLARAGADLCGEPHSEDPASPAGEPCATCLASGHGKAAAGPAGPAAKTARPGVDALPGPDAAAPRAARQGPGAPRAPPAQV